MYGWEIGASVVCGVEDDDEASGMDDEEGTLEEPDDVADSLDVEDPEGFDVERSSAGASEPRVGIVGAVATRSWGLGCAGAHWVAWETSAGGVTRDGG